MVIASTILKPTRTEDILISMLKEKKGYGRGYGIPHWVQNQTRDFLTDPHAVLYFRYCEINYYRSVFHHLNDHLEYHEQLSSEFHQFASQDDYQDEPWLPIMRAFIEQLEATRDDFKLLLEYHTCNDENTVDQDILYLLFDYAGDPFVLLSILNSDDTRNGYSTPYVFTVLKECFFHFADGCIRCGSCDAYWYTGDGNRWFFEATIGIVHEKVQLEDLLSDLVIDDDGNGTCPRCNTGRLIT